MPTYKCWKCGRDSYEVGGRPICCHCRAAYRTAQENAAVRALIRSALESLNGQEIDLRAATEEKPNV